MKFIEILIFFRCFCMHKENFENYYLKVWKSVNIMLLKTFKRNKEIFRVYKLKKKV